LRASKDADTGACGRSFEARASARAPQDDELFYPDSPMPHDEPWQRHQRERWTRPDAHLWIRPDAARFYKPGTDLAEIFPALARERDAEDAAIAAELARLLALRDELMEIKAELARRRREDEVKYSPDQPRVPKRNPGGGQFTRLGGDGQSPSTNIAQPMGDINLGDASSSDDTSGLLHITITPDASDSEGVQLAGDPSDDLGNTPLDDPPPKIPPRKPDTREGRMAFVRTAARWVGRQLVRHAPTVDAFFRALDQVEQINALTAAIKSANDPARTLEELQARVSPTSQPGYHDHHIVGQHAENRARFGDSLIDSRENLVRIPVLKHIDISAWYQKRNEKFGDLSPRDYLRDKDWDEQMRVGLDRLRTSGVLR
jgi:hypothetical protein